MNDEPRTVGDDLTDIRSTFGAIACCCLQAAALSSLSSFKSNECSESKLDATGFDSVDARSPEHAHRLWQYHGVADLSTASTWSRSPATQGNLAFGRVPSDQYESVIMPAVMLVSTFFSLLADEFRSWTTTSTMPRHPGDAPERESLLAAATSALRGRISLLLPRTGSTGRSPLRGSESQVLRCEGIPDVREQGRSA